MAVVMGVILAANAPAQAVISLDLESTTTEIVLGESFDLTWSSLEAESLVASGDWSGSKAIPDGSETITPAEPGYHSYTLTADGDEGWQDTVEVYVVSPDKVTPAPVIFDGCDVIVPESPHVIYVAGLEGSHELEAGTYPAGYFFVHGLPSYFYTGIEDGYEYADDADTMWIQNIPAECLEGSTLITASTDKCEVTITNVADETVSIDAAFGEAEPDGIMDLAASATRTFKTDLDALEFVATTESLDFQIGEIQTDCGISGGSDHPTVAPAAGR